MMNIGLMPRSLPMPTKMPRYWGCRILLPQVLQPPPPPSPLPPPDGRKPSAHHGAVPPNHGEDSPASYQLPGLGRSLQPPPNNQPPPDELGPLNPQTGPEPGPSGPSGPSGARIASPDGSVLLTGSEPTYA